MLKGSTIHQSIMNKGGSGLNVIGVTFDKNSNVLVPTVNGKVSKLPNYKVTDTVRSIHFFVSVIMNVQQLSSKHVQLLSDRVENVILPEFTMEHPEFINIYNPIEIKGPYVSNIKVSHWVNINVCYVPDKLEETNELVNLISKAYKDICKEAKLEFEDIFVIAKLKSSVFESQIHPDNLYSIRMSANYQNFNNYSSHSNIKIIQPKGIVVRDITTNSGLSVDYSKKFNDDGALGTVEESLFDDRFKIVELVVQKFIDKGEGLIIPSFVSRTINVYKVEKDSPLISNKGGKIIIGKLGVSMKENPKETKLLDEVVMEFIQLNSKVSRKVNMNISHIIGKVITGKVIEKYLVGDDLNNN